MHPSRRAFLLEGAGVALFASAARYSSAQGTAADGLARIDDFLTSFLAENRIPGAALAITKEGRLVYARGFGMADRETSRAVGATDLFRIASISKSITAVAILQAVESGRLSLDDKVWHVLALPAPADARWKDITIRHLLLHTGGWDPAGTKFDPVFASRTIANALGIALPLKPGDIVQFMLQKPLDFDPGSRHAYSNFGYLLLGRVIERLSGVTYAAHVAKHVLAPLGIRRMRLARTPAIDRAATEVSYYADQEPDGPAVVGGIGETVPAPYGRFSLEVMDANGGWLGSAVDLARFGAAFDVPERCPVLRPESLRLMFARPAGDAGEEVGGNYVGFGWFVWPRNDRPHHAFTTSNGHTAGTSSYLMRRHDGMNWAVLFNTGNAPDGQPLMLKFRDASASVLNGVTHWPSHDLFTELL